VTELELRMGLDSAFEQALYPLQSGTEPVGVLFSGGVDSALLAWELRHLPGVVLCTMGREGSSDLQAGREGAHLLGLPWARVTVGSEEVRSAERRFSVALEGLTRVSRSVLLSLALAIEGSSPRLLVCGQGVDELFLGYAHYRGLSVEEADRRSREDLERLHETDWPRTVRVAETVGKEIIAPYLEPAFEDAARRVPIEARLPGDSPKRFFREWAVARGLPVDLSVRPKKALQYGSGVDSLSRQLERSRS
jgi:asparagine synthase (glutamine-hydrolysing)